MTAAGRWGRCRVHEPSRVDPQASAGDPGWNVGAHAVCGRVHLGHGVHRAHKQRLVDLCQEQRVIVVKVWGVGDGGGDLVQLGLCHSLSCLFPCSLDDLQGSCDAGS